MPNANPADTGQALAPDAIGTWTPSQLIKFMQDTIRNDPPPLPTTAQTEELTVTRKLTVNDEMLVVSQANFHVVGKPGEPAFQNTWANFGSGYQVAGFWIDALGIVHLRGMIASGVVGSAAFQLPPGFRPVGTELFGTMSSSNSGRIDVQSGGLVIPLTPTTNTWVTLSGISFKTLT